MTILDSNYVISGTTQEALLDSLAKIDQATCFDTFEGIDILIASIDYEHSDEDYLAYYQLDPAYTYTIQSVLLSEDHLLTNPKVYQKKPLGFFYGMGFNDEQLQLAKDVGFFLICSIHGDRDTPVYLMPAKDFLTPFSKKLNMGKMSDYPSIFRDIHLAELLGEQDLLNRCPKVIPPMKLLYRTSGSQTAHPRGGVVYSAFSSKTNDPYTAETEHTHNAEDTQAIFDCLQKSFSPIQVERWTISYKRANIDAKFPQLHDNDTGITIGFRFSFSDIGEQSYALQSLLYFPDNTVICCGKAVKTPHKSRLNCEAFVNLYLQNFSFTKKCITMLKKAKETSEPNMIEKTQSFLKKIKLELAYSKKDFAAAWSTAPLIHKGTLFDVYHNVALIVDYDKQRADAQNQWLQDSQVPEEEKEQVESLVEEHYRRVLLSTETLF